MVNDVTAASLHRLAAPRADGPVLSLFLGLDPSQVPTPPSREAAVDSLLHEARRLVEAGDLGHGARVRLREALGELDERLRPSAGAQADGARGLAAFVRAGSDEPVELLRLPAPVDSQAVLDALPHVAPLIGLVGATRFCVALVNRSSATFLLGDEHGLQRTGAIEDDVKGQHQKGGWSQRRYEESVEQEVLHHLDRVSRALDTALVKRDLFDRLVLAAPAELRNEVRDRLSRPVDEAICGVVDVDQSSAGVAEVLDAARPAMRRCAEREVRDALDRLQAGVGSAGGHGAHGLAAVLEALGQRRVEILLLDAGLHPRGRRCPSCGWLSLDAERCPAEDVPTQPVADLAEAAIAAAYGQDAQVRVLADEPRLQTLGGAGAVLRF